MDSSLSSAIYMQSPVYGYHCIDICATHLEHSDIGPDLVAIHALSGCNSVAATYGIGKTTALKTATKGFGVTVAQWVGVACYWSKVKHD